MTTSLISSSTEKLPVAIIGAGPIGLAAAAHLIKRGETPIIFDAADQVAAGVRTWGHVRMFSPWQYNVDDAARELLESHGWQMPPKNELPTGDELVGNYLLPLAETSEIAPHVHLNSRVTAISRRHIDKMKDVDRADTPFVIQVDQEESVQRFFARAIIDASGTWATPNPIGADGLTLPGETRYAGQIYYGIPNLLDEDKQRYLNQRIAVIGGGHSAINAILELEDLLTEYPATQIHWILRKGRIDDAYGGLGNDALPGRGLLGLRIKHLVDAGKIQVHTPFYIQAINADSAEDADGGLQILGEVPVGAADTIIVDEIIAATGARPNLSFLSELRVTLDPAVESPPALAPLIDPNQHSCGTVRPHGEAELRHPEPNFYIVGMKSYGRAPTFLLATGHEQVRSVVAGLTGDWSAAKDVQLSLPATGICNGSIASIGEAASVVGKEIKNTLKQVVAGDVSSTCCVKDTRVPVAAVGEAQPASSCCGTTCC